MNSTTRVSEFLNLGKLGVSLLVTLCFIKDGQKFKDGSQISTLAIPVVSSVEYFSRQFCVRDQEGNF